MGINSRGKNVNVQDLRRSRTMWKLCFSQHVNTSEDLREDRETKLWFFTKEYLEIENLCKNLNNLNMKRF